jgi:hypothetical protein
VHPSGARIAILHRKMADQQRGADGETRAGNQAHTHSNNDGDGKEVASLEPNGTKSREKEDGRKSRLVLL